LRIAKEAAVPTEITMSVIDVTANFDDVMQRVADGETIIVTRGEAQIAAIIPMKDFKVDR